MFCVLSKLSDGEPSKEKCHVFREIKQSVRKNKGKRKGKRKKKSRIRRTKSAKADVNS